MILVIFHSHMIPVDASTWSEREREGARQMLTEKPSPESLWPEASSSLAASSRSGLVSDPFNDILKQKD